MELEFSGQIFEKILKYHISWKSLEWQPSCSMRTEGPTDMTKVTAALRKYANAPKIRQKQTTQIYKKIGDGLRPVSLYNAMGQT
jgi:hypothetical protein